MPPKRNMSIHYLMNDGPVSFERHRGGSGGALVCTSKGGWRASTMQLDAHPPATINSSTEIVVQPKRLRVCIPLASVPTMPRFCGHCIEQWPPRRRRNAVDHKLMNIIFVIIWYYYAFKPLLHPAGRFRSFPTTRGRVTDGYSMSSGPSGQLNIHRRPLREPEMHRRGDEQPL